MSFQFHHRGLALAAALVVSAGNSPTAGAQAGDISVPVDIRGGTATFDAPTNVPAISIHGKSVALAGHAAIRAADGRLVIEALEATVPVKTINTGMELRNDHMRKQVFTTPDGQAPDLTFSAASATCSGTDRDSVCQLAGDLRVRGIAKPLTIALKVTRERDGFRAIGQGVVKLSTYGIPIPSQLGVTVDDEVKLRLEFVARHADTTVARRIDR